MLQKPIIEIKRTSEHFITALIESGILIVTGNGLKCAEQKSPAAGKHTGLIKKTLHRDYITERREIQCIEAIHKTML